jgi:hypothetical protein
VKAKLKIQESELMKKNNDFDQGPKSHSQSVNKDTVAVKKQVKWLKNELKRRDEFIL